MCAASPPSPPFFPSLCWNFLAWIMSWDQNEFSDLIWRVHAPNGSKPEGEEGHRGSLSEGHRAKWGKPR